MAPILSRGGGDEFKGHDTDKTCVLDFHKERFKQPLSFQCGGAILCEHTYLAFLTNNQQLKAFQITKTLESTSIMLSCRIDV